MVTLKAEGEEEGKQVHLPVRPGAAALGVCSVDWAPLQLFHANREWVCWGCSCRTLLQRLLILLVKRISCYFLPRSIAFDLELRTLH